MELSPYLRGVPQLPDALLAVDHEQLAHADRLREQLLVAELKRRIRIARTLWELVHGPVVVEPATDPDYKAPQ